MTQNQNAESDNLILNNIQLEQSQMTRLNDIKTRKIKKLKTKLLSTLRQNHTIRAKLRKVVLIKKRKKRLTKKEKKINKKRMLEIRQLTNKLNRNNETIKELATEINNKRIKKFVKDNKQTSLTLSINNNLNSTLRSMLAENSRVPRQLIQLEIIGADGNQTYYTITPANINSFSYLLEGETEAEDELFGSDLALVRTFKGLQEITFNKLKLPKRQRASGAFFPYTHILDGMDFSRYGVFDKVVADNYKDNCLYNALKYAGLVPSKLRELKQFIKNRFVPLSSLTSICEILKINIKLKQLTTGASGQKTTNYPKKHVKENDTFLIGLINEHYFVIDDETNITRFALENYELIKHQQKFFNIRGLINGKTPKREKNRSINSFVLMKCLIENKEKILKPIELDGLLMATQYYDISDNILNLEYNEADLKTEDYKKISEKQMSKYKQQVFFDFETYNTKRTINNKEVSIAVPYLCSYIKDGETTPHTFYGEDCGYQLLKSLDTDTLLVAHNSSFDINFIIRYVVGFSIIKKGSSVITYDGLFKNYNTKKEIRIGVKDSYKLITMPLKKFGKCFNLEMKKEVMNYRMYDTYFNNKKKYGENSFPIEEALKGIVKEDRQDFIKNIEEWNCKIDENNFDLIKYSARYCEIDCKVLMDGYNVFRKNVMVGLGEDFDINYILTSASLAHKTMLNAGCYEGCYRLNGVPRRFIEQSCIGGRVALMNNEKLMKRHVMIVDFDAVSLYPSAIIRLAEIGGFLMGTPKVIQPDQLNMNFLSKQDGYFVEIVINKVKKHYKLPTTNYYENNKRHYTNDITGKRMIVNRFTLEDYINFQQIDFKLIRGYYYNEGRNPICGKLIKNLFEQRLKYKNEKNPVEQVYKLVLNSIYGKTLLKEINTETKIINSKKSFDTYFYNKYNFIKDAEKIYGCEKFFIRENKPVNNHYNFSHIGSEILSMSKRIMNEVCFTAEDNGVELFYTDTDSLHLLKKDISIIETNYRLKYGRELIGKNLGQFHSDFELDGAIKSTVYASDSIFLGKKVYIDRLVGLNEKGEKVYGWHMRMKGVSKKAIEHMAQQTNIRDPLHIYEKLYNGEEITFDLTCGNTIVKFRFKNNFIVQEIQDFTRTVSF